MVGHIAYSLYKKEKISFIKEFKRKHQADPSDTELKSFHESCSVPARIESYRKEATTILQDFIGMSFEESSKQILSDFAKEQDEHLKKVIAPLLPDKEKWPEKESMKARYVHGIAQSLLGAIILPLLVGLILFAWKHSVNDIWLTLSDFFGALAR